MTVFDTGYHRNRDDYLFLALLAGLAAAMFLVPVLEGRIACPGACPIKRAFGLDCPGCGLIRAGRSLVGRDPGAAFRFNPLIFLIVPYCLYRFAAILTGLTTGRVLVRDWPRGFTDWYQYSFLAVWGLLTAVRLMDWAVPGISRFLHLPFMLD